MTDLFNSLTCVVKAIVPCDGCREQDFVYIEEIEFCTRGQAYNDVREALKEAGWKFSTDRKYYCSQECMERSTEPKVCETCGQELPI